jgi:putative endonuclease
MKVYVIQSEVDASQYVGMSSDPSRRLSEHNSGKVRSTRAKVPWTIIHTESFDTRVAAREREKYLKTSAGRRFRKNLLGG